MPIELADGLAVAEKVARLAGLGVAGDVGLDRPAETIEDEFEFVAAVAVAARRTDGVGGEEVEVAADIEVALPQVAGGDLQCQFAIHGCARVRRVSPFVRS